MAYQSVSLVSKGDPFAILRSWVNVELDPLLLFPNAGSCTLLAPLVSMVPMFQSEFTHFSFSRRRLPSPLQSSQGTFILPTRPGPSYYQRQRG